MFAHHRLILGGRRGRLAAIALSLAILASAAWLVLRSSRGPSSLNGVCLLSDAQMRNVIGAFTTPKGNYVCESCGCESGGTYSFDAPCGEGQEGGGSYAPSLNPGPLNIRDTVAGPSVSAVGGGLGVQFQYDSDLADGTNSPLNLGLGYGWMHSYEMSLMEAGQDMAWIQANGRISFYDGGPLGFTPMAGEFSSLQRLGGGVFEITTTLGTVYRFSRTVSGLWPGVRHLLTSITDSNNRATMLNYNAQDQLVSVLDPFGHQLLFTYDGLGRLIEIADPLGRITRLSYSGQGQLNRITLPDGMEIAYQYDAARRMTRKTVAGPCPPPAPAPARGDVDCNSRIDSDDVDPFIEALLDPMTYEANHPACGLIAADLNGDGRVDGKDIQPFIGALVAGPPPPCPPAEEYVIDYDPTTGRFAAMRDLNGNIVFTIAGIASWQVDHALSLLSGVMRYVPGSTTVINGRGFGWTYAYDDRGQITRVEAPLVPGQPAVRNYEYDAGSRRVRKFTDARGNDSERTFDSNGNVTQVIDAEGNVTLMEYTHVIPALMTRKVEPDLDEWLWTYDANGNLLEEIDPLIEVPDDGTTEYVYGGFGRLVQMVDRNGHVTEYTYDGLSRLQTQRVDPGGLDLVTQYQYDAVGNRTVVIDPRGITTEYQYDSRDRVIRETRDPGGPPRLNITTRYEYDGRSNRTAVTRPNGEPTPDPTDFRTRYEYDARDRLMRETDALGHQTTYQYDGSNNRVQTTDANGNVTKYQYDERNRLSRQVDDAGGGPADLNITTRYEYDAANNRTKTTREMDDVPDDGPDRVTEYHYDALNRPTLQIVDPGIPPAQFNLTTRYEYASTGCGCGGTPGTSLVTCLVDPEGKVTRYQYDALDRRVRVIRQVGTQDCAAAEDGDDAVTITEYDPVGNVLDTRVLNEPPLRPDLATTSSYDSADRRIEQRVDPSDANLLTEYFYDSDSNRIMEARPNGNAIEYEYDNANRQVHSFDPLGQISRTQYDANGNVTERRDGNNFPTTYTYDADDRLICEIDPLGRSTCYQYDNLANVVEITDRKDNLTIYEYDGVYRRTEEVRAAAGSADPPLDITTEYRYDDAGNLRELKAHNPTADHPAEVQITEYQYDAGNRRIREIYPDDEDGRPRDKLFEYDGVGNVFKRTDQNRDETHYLYDDLHRLIRRSYVIHAGSLTYPSVQSPDTYTYDRASQMLSALHDYALPEPDVALTYAYDGVGRIARQTQDGLGSPPGGWPIDYSYQIDPLVNRREIRYPSTRVVHEDYDQRDRLNVVSDQPSGSLIADRDYDAGNRQTHQLYGNGTTTDWSYNANDWTTRITHSNGGGPFIDLEYGHDFEGNPSFCKHHHAPDTSELYAYDAAYRLTDFQRGTLNGANDGIVTYTPYAGETQRQQWTLEPLGNWRVNEIRRDNLDTCEERFANKVNEYTTLEPNQSCPPPGGVPMAMTHDDNGNLATDPTGGPGGVGMRYEYDVENRLTRATRLIDSAVVGQYFYDALGRRVRKTVSNSGPLDGTTQYLLNERWQTLAEYDAAGVPLREFTYGTYIDEPLTLDRNLDADGTAIGLGDQRLFYHRNMLYSIYGLTDSSAGLVEAYRYDAYGLQTVLDDGNELDGIVNFTYNDVVTIAGGSSLDNPYLFTGRVLEGELADYYYRGRWQDPRLGRFAQRDPLSYDDAPSLYVYTRSRPIFGVDPQGRLTVRMLRKHLSEDGATCGQRHGIAWDFVLANPAPCDGYFVQKVSYYSRINQCADCPNNVPDNQYTGAYWEAWPVTKKNYTADSRMKGGFQYTDAAWQPHTEGRCGAVRQDGEIKFFCKDKDDPAAGGVGTGNLERHGWRPGNTGSPTITSGGVPSTPIPPDWWDKKAVEGPAKRWFTSLWCCCQGQGRVSQSDASPKTSSSDDPMEVRQSFGDRPIRRRR